VVLDKLLSKLSVEVEPFALCHISRGWRLRLPEPPVPLLHFVLQGEGAILGRTDQPQPLTPSWFVVVPPGAKHALQASGQIEHERRIGPPPDGSPVCRLVGGSKTDASFVVACGLVKVQYGPAVSLFDHLKDVLPADLSGVPLVSAAFNGILAEQAGLDPGSTTLTRALMTQCLVHFFRQVGSNGSLPWLDALEDPRLGRVIDCILEDPAANHTVENLAETASMSRSAFAEQFVVAFGQTPMAMVQHVRMQHAAHLLRQGGTASIDQVAARSGYSSRSHFSAAFRRHHGVSPTEFRVGTV
jgi:AraC-like DNA-binding protein